MFTEITETRDSETNVFHRTTKYNAPVLNEENTVVLIEN